VTSYTLRWLAHRKPAAEYVFEQVFLAQYQGIYRLLFRIVGSAGDAEDLAQETFLRLYRQPFEAGRQHNLPAWLYRVATNLAYNHLRSRQRSAHRDEALEHQSPAEERVAPDPAVLVQRSDEQGAVRAVLASLPERQAQLLLLRHAGFSYRELAEAVGVAAGSVGTLLARAEAAFEAAYRAREVAGHGQAIDGGMKDGM
jgi:RNA polymerase sigma-70 factor (ECF subfamily)